MSESNRASAFVRRRSFGERSLIAFAAVLVGALVGVGTILFREGFALLQAFFFGAPLSTGEYLERALDPRVLLFVPALGGLAMALLNRYALPGQRPQGVVDVMLAGENGGAPIRLRTGLAAVAASTISIGTGGSVGREGPMIHLGATLGGWIARRLRVDAEVGRRMLAWGVAAGVAASFNAPIAGAIFAAEVIVGNYRANAFGPIAVASVSGTIVSRLYFGELNEFTVPEILIRSYVEIPSFLLFGVVCALASIAFIRLPSAIRAVWDRLRMPPLLRPVVAGMLLAVVACGLPRVLGVGYETTSLAIAGEVTASVAFALFFAKLAMTALYFGSGCSGGIFSPSLMLGALAGCVWAAGVAWLMPEIASSSSVYALVGMGALAAANLGAPLSSVVIIFEMTGNYTITLAVLLATLTCSVIVNQLWGFSFFTWQLAERARSQTNESEPNEDAR
jgi:CIC family chloride channel protein